MWSVRIESNQVKKNSSVSCPILLSRCGSGAVISWLISSSREKSHHRASLLIPSQLIVSNSIGCCPCSSCLGKLVHVLSYPFASHHFKFGLVLTELRLSDPAMCFHILSHGCKSNLGLFVTRRGLSVHVKAQPFGSSREKKLLGLSGHCIARQIQCHGVLSNRIES